MIGYEPQNNHDRIVSQQGEWRGMAGKQGGRTLVICQTRGMVSLVIPSQIAY